METGEASNGQSTSQPPITQPLEAQIPLQALGALPQVEIVNNSQVAQPSKTDSEPQVIKIDEDSKDSPRSDLQNFVSLEGERHPVLATAANPNSSTAYRKVYCNCRVSCEEGRCSCLKAKVQFSIHCHHGEWDCGRLANGIHFFRHALVPNEEDVGGEDSDFEMSDDHEDYDFTDELS